MRTIYWFWSMVVLAMVVLQIAFAGYGAFHAAHKLEDEGSSITEDAFNHPFELHIALGYLLWLAVMVLLVFGVIAGIGKWRLGKHGVLALLLTLQVLLAWFAFEVPAIGGFHALNAFLILGVAISIVWEGWQERKGRSATLAPVT